MKKCQKCGKEATYIDVVIRKGGQIEETNLCDQCAQEAGLTPKHYQTVSDLLNQEVAKQIGRPQATAQQPTCPNCGLTWSEFRERGVLGCPACYDEFEERLIPLLQRTHEGGTAHVGAAPAQPGGEQAATTRLVQRLRKQLAEALNAEQYEKAAQLRDSLQDLGADRDAPEAMESGE